jgi:hypothetical protein
MTTAEIFPPEMELIKFIESLGALVWSRYQQRFPQIWKINKFELTDRSSFPPFASFRFEKENPILINQLKDAVKTFKGTVTWVMGEHKRTPLPGSNWIICPQRFWEVNEIAANEFKSSGEYMAEHQPEFGPIAYNDILLLITHLKQYKFT